METQRLVLKHKSPVTPKYLDVATGHVKESDIEKMKDKDGGLCVYPYEWGVWLAVSRGVSGRALRRAGYSNGLVQVWAMAKRTGCWFVRLDCDGTIYQCLPHYDW